MTTIPTRYSVRKSSQDRLICPIYYIYDNTKKEDVCPYMMFFTSFSQAQDKADYLNTQQIIGQPLILTI